MSRQSGFTIVELIIVIAVIAAVALISIPNIIGMMPDYRLRSAAHDLFSDFQKAKLEAVKRNINTAVCFSTSGYTVFVDTDSDFVPDAGEPVVVTFDRHPQAILGGHPPVPVLSLRHRLLLLERAGAARCR